MGEGIVREFGMDMYRLLCLKWITNKDLPYSTGSSAQRYVAAWMGGEFGGEWIYVWLSPFTVHQKLLQHWESAMKGKVIQLYPTLVTPWTIQFMEFLQARILEWVAFPFSRGSSQLRNRTEVSRTAGRFFTRWATREDSIIGYMPKQKVFK